MRKGFVYLDSSVPLAQLLREPRLPPEDLWNESLISSRLLEYEAWNVLHRRGAAERLGKALRTALGRIAMIELVEPVIGDFGEQAIDGLRTLDALHLASVRFLIEESQHVRLATYDERLAKAADRAGIELYPLQ